MVRGRGAWLRGRGARAICGAEALLYGFDGLPCGSDSDVVWQIHVGTNGNIQSYPKHCVGMVAAGLPWKGRALKLEA